MWWRSKKAAVKKGVTGIFIVLAILGVILISSYASATLLKAGEKSNQYLNGNITCEPLIDTVFWGAVGSKSAADTQNFVWNRSFEGNTYDSYDCPGYKDCNITSLYSYSRYLNVGADASVTAGTLYCEMTDDTATTRFIANPTETVSSTVGPRLECGEGGSPDSCVIANSGLNDNTYNYSVTCVAPGGGSGKQAGVVDAFNINYTWCWTPIIYDAYATPDSATFDQTFNFTINVTNPEANTTVRLLTRPLGGSWSQSGSDQYCVNCAQETLTFQVSGLTSGDVGDWEFKFNATDNESFSVEAGDSSVIGTATNECLDSGNDCTFTVQDTGGAEPGSPSFNTPLVRGVQSGFVGGWGEDWYFSINASDADGDDFNISLQVDTGSGFSTLETQECTASCDTWNIYNFTTPNFQCNDITATAEYKFYAIDNNSLENQGDPYEFEIEQNDLNLIYTAGDNSISNRSGSQTTPLIVRINDTDNRTIVNSGVNSTLYVQFNDVSYDSGTLNTTNSSGYSNYNFDAACTPTKYAVGDRDWYVQASGNACYKTTSSSTFNTSIRGDISLEYTTPSGANNFTQEQSITFLGATTDDCTDSLESTVTYSANISAVDGFFCTDNTKVGANAYTCAYTTDLTTSEGWYNATIAANASFHYDNSTQKTDNPGLFYILPRYKLESPQGNSTATGSTSDGWGSPNWNFSVLASSGDANNIINTSLYLGQSVNPATTCEATGSCANQTPISCETCNTQPIYWYKNFTYNDIGSWFYQFKMDNTDVTSTSGTENFVTITKDETNISYGGVGNESNPVADSTSTNLSVRVYDLDKASFNVTVPSANVTFKLVDPGYTGGEKIIGYGSTNATGHARVEFTPLCEDGYESGAQNWAAEIGSSDDYYQASLSENFTIDIDTSQCTTGVSIDAIYNPDEVFENKLFVVNASVNSFGGTANDVNATLTVPAGWIITGGAVKDLGSVSGPEPVSWIVNATTYGQNNVTVFVNSSNAGNDTDYSSVFNVYKETLQGTADSPTLPQTITSSNSLETSWQCDIGEYRIATLQLTGNSSQGSTLRVETYNGTDYVDVLHSRWFNTSNAIETLDVKLLESQIQANETGYCQIRVTNLDGNDFELTDVTLDTYYDESIGVRDIYTTINGMNVTGTETDETALDSVSVVVENSVFDTAYSLDVNLTITNSSGSVVNTSVNSGIALGAASQITTTFNNIDTSSWNSGNYTLATYVTSNESYVNNRTETFIFEDIAVYTDATDYICNSTTETFSVTLNHPFTDSVDYNVSLEMPSGWSYSGFEWINATSIGNYTATFNITSSTSSAENVTINATASYTYPTAKTKTAQHDIEESNSLPILEVTRETPETAGGNRVFESALTVHNKGCGSTSAATVTETLSTGWTPANPSIQENAYGTDVELVSAVTDLETNVITWNLGTIAEDKYAVLTYQIKSPTTTATVGTLDYNVSWDGSRNVAESPSSIVQTLNYTSESHLQFELEAQQQSAYPQTETRSIQPNETYNYTLTVTNIGDINATGWNVTLAVPNVCDVPAVYQSGTYDAGNDLVTWELAELQPRNPRDLNLTFNCTDVDEFTLVAQGVKDTSSVSSYSNSSISSCEFSSGNSCSSESEFTFTKPADPRYEKLKFVNTSVYYNWDGYNVTIGEGYLNFTDDNGKDRILWQNYSQLAAGTSGTVWNNYTIDSADQSNFVDSARNFGLYAFTDATASESGNVTLEQLDYTWTTGKLFEEPQDLFMSVKVYTYVPLFQNEKLYINGNALTSANSSAEKTGGWGEEFNFSVEVADRFDRDVTVYAWHKKGAGAWELIGSDTCTSCPNSYSQINFTYNYNGTDIGATDGWQFKFNATNADGSSTQSGFTYTVEKDDIDTDYIAPGNEVNINRSDTTIFSVRSFDRDNQTYPSGSSQGVGKVYVSIFDINSFESSPSTIATDSGYINRSIANAEWCADTSQYYLGKHAWYGGTEGSDYIKNNLTKDYIGYRNFTLVGSLTNTLSLPDASTNFTRGNSITFDSSVVDDCSVDSTTAATIVYNMSTQASGGYWSSCTADATGTCDITTNSSFPLGYYNLTTTTSRLGHNTKIDLNESLFFLGTVSQLDDPRKTPSATVVPWGQSPYTFRVNVTDIDDNNVSVELWIKNSSTGTYNLENSTSCVSCNDYVFVTNKTFTSDSINGNVWYFKFNSTDSASIGVNETAEITFNVTTDSIDFISIVGDGAAINRSETNPGNVLNLSAIVQDLILTQNTLNPSTPNVSLSEISFKINNGTSYLENVSEEFINGSTNYYREFNPGCNYVPGNQNWYVEVNGSSAYSDNITTIGSLKVEIYGNNTATYSSPIGQQAYERGSSVTFTGSLSDDCGVNVSSANVWFNISSGATSYLCGPETNVSGNVYNCEFDTTGKNVGVYNVTMVGSKSFYNNGTDLEEDAIEIKSTPALSDARVDIESDGWGVSRTFSVNVTDNTGDTVTVYAWQDLGSGWELIGSDSCVSCSNDVLSFSTGYLCSERGTGKLFKFNSTDTEGNSDETTIGGGDYRSDNAYTIERDNVVVEYFTGNETTANRLNQSLLGVRVYDSDNQTYSLEETATVTFNVSKNSQGSTQASIGTNSTNATGHAIRYFTPDGTYDVSKQDWSGSVLTQNCYAYNTTSTGYGLETTTLTNVPQLKDENVDVVADGWGIDRTFSINVSDTNNTATVSLWRASSAISPNWILMNSTTYSSIGNWEEISFNQVFTPNLQGTWYYMFNATNAVGNVNDTGEDTVDTNNYFTLEANNILLEYVDGHNSISNRSASQTTRLSFRVQDENGTYLSGFPMKFHVQPSGTTYFTDDYFVVNTNSSGYANFDFDATCSGDVSGAPKFLVGSQNWKVTVNDSELSNYQQNDSSNFISRNLSVQGDILLDFSTPDGSTNFTQESTITFLGATTDDCGDALVTNVQYDANSSLNDFTCTDNTQIGANAFQCVFQTYLNTTRGYYNVTMNADKANHYDNSSTNSDTPGLFYILPKKKLENPQGNASTGLVSDGWGTYNWNFSVVASSGDIDNVLQNDLFLGQSVNPTTNCDALDPACVPQTSLICENCTDQLSYWYKNFTASDIGTWYYQFKFNDTALTSTSGTENTVVVTKDETNISYGGVGNVSTPAADSDSQNLSVQVYDLDKGSFNVTVPSANVTFKLLDAGYTGGEKVIGYGSTNATGHARFEFTPLCSDGYESGSQIWVGEIESTDSYYQTSISDNFTININTGACETGVSVDAIYTADQVFENNLFVVNASINAFGGTANDVNASLTVPAGWTIVGGSVKDLGSVAGPTPVSWTVNATTYGTHNVTVFANSSNAGNDTLASGTFNVYKESLEGTASSPTLPQTITSSNSLETSWQCEIGEYRVATLQLTGNSSTGSTLRVETYNGTDYVDVLHSHWFNTSNAIETLDVKLLESQIQANETGYCQIRVTNLDGNDLELTDVTLDTYYDETVSVRDIYTTINGMNVTGTETDETTLDSVSVIVENSVFDTAYSVDVNLTITNSSGDVVNTSVNSGIALGAASQITTTFNNIDTSSWNSGNYTLATYVTSNESYVNNRTETFIFEDIAVYTDATDYICNSTTETFSVTLNHPFTDSIDYNVSLEMPSGWSYSGFEWINATSIGNYTTTFNITSSSSAAENVTINATASYTYPTAKTKTAQHDIEESNSLPILEVTRETPETAGGNRVFESALTVHNKGCSAVSSATVTETLSTGWTPANPSIQENAYGTDVELVSAATDLETNVITWNLGTIAEDKYAVLTYQIKSPTTTATVGTLDYNVSWDGSRYVAESPSSTVQTLNYTSESHLQFELEAQQQSAYPQTETRSIQPNETYNYTLTVTNIGDINATGWNVTLATPSTCNVPNVYQSGSYDSGNDLVTWELAELAPRNPRDLNLTFNCTDVDEFTLVAQGIKDTSSVSSYSNSSIDSCEFSSGNSCSSESEFAFTKPADPRYEELKFVNTSVYYNWDGYNVTIGEGYLNFTDDNGKDRILWQNYSQLAAGTSGSVWNNYTIDSADQSNFVDSARNFGLYAFTDATASEFGNVTLEQLDYTWTTGKLFEEPQDLFMSVKVYTYTPLFQNEKLYISGSELTSTNSSAEKTGGWGESFNFSVEVADRFNRDVTVYAWHKKGADDYSLVDSYLCSNCPSTYSQINFTYDYNGTDISATDGWVFKFNATNADGSSTQSGFTYTVEKDDINTEYIAPSNEVSINRSDSTVFSVRSFDRDNQTYPNGSTEAVGKIYVSVFDIGTFESSPTELGADDGFINRTVTNAEWCADTGQYYLGKHAWYGGTEAADYVKTNLTKDNIGYRNFTLVGSLTNTLSTPDGTSNFTRGSAITFEGSAADDCSVDVTGSSTIIYNMSTQNGGGYWATCTASAGGDCQITTNSSFPVGYYNVTMSSTKSGHNDETLTNENLFFLRSVPQLTDARVDIESDGWGVQRTFSVNVSDNTGDTVTVQLWENLGSGFELVGTDSCISCDNTPLSFSTGYQCSERGTGKTFKFNSTDTEGNSDETSIGGGDYRSDNTFAIERDNVIVEYFTGNQTVANLLNSSILGVRVYDSDNQTYNLEETATVTFNVSKTGLGSTQSSIGTNTTNSTGHSVFSFTPDGTYTVGEQDWSGSVLTQNCYTYNTTSTGYGLETTTLTNAPQLVNGTVNPQSDGWGIQKTFNITVKDDNNTATVRLWRASSAVSPNWILMDSGTYTDVGNWETLSFTQTFDSNLIGDWYYMFNATNEVGNVNDTGENTVNTNNNFTIERENLLLEYVNGHDSTANRSASQTTRLSFRVQDENGTYLSGFPIKFHVQPSGTTYFTDDYFVVNTNASGYANFDFDATCSGDVSGAPKFLVGSQNWKVTVNDSKLGNYQQNDSSNFISRNLSVQGDISLDFSTPSGANNFTQEQTITFLGATTDDCGDALVTSVVYDANSSLNDFACTDNTQIGANAFQCVYQTYLNTTRGWYNVTMNANKLNHYDNSTTNSDQPGLFYILPKKKLENPTGNASTGLTSDGWGTQNWNFSVVASSGDIDNVLQTDLFLGQGVNPTTNCDALDPACVPQTSLICENCTDKLEYWYKNFTADDVGTWYYQFKLNDTAITSTSGTENTVVVTKDETNISYGGSGNESTVIYQTQPQNLTVRVFDLDKNTYNVTVPNANVTFKLIDAGYAGGEKIIGYADTNATGHARFEFNASTCNYIEGTQNWVGEIESTDSYYQTSISDNFTTTLELPGCEAAISVEQISTPKETFENINFRVNATIAAFISTANNVNATLNVPAGWTVSPGATQDLGSVEVGTPETLSWSVNATSAGEFNVSVFADSSDAGNDTRISSLFDVHKESFEGSASSPSLPTTISPNSNEIIKWQCDVGDYRIASLNLNLNTSNSILPVRVETYSGTEFIDVLHSKYVNTNNNIETTKVPLLENQINSDETGFCTLRVSNLGNNDLSVDDVTLDAYYDEAVKVRDVYSTVSGFNTTGLETSDELVNVSILVDNSFNEAHSLNVNLTIKNSTTTVFSSENTGLTLGALSSETSVFENVNTSTWTSGNYTLEALITGNFTSSSNENRSETLVFEDVEVYANSEDYMCSSTTEEFIVTVYHPFTDEIEYNVSLEMPSGWSYSGAQQENISTIGNTTFVFNITSGTNEANQTINASVEYVYPGVSKNKQAQHDIEESSSIPILEITRETPEFVSNGTEFVSRLAVYNKGCAAAESVSLTETITSGWTAYTPSVDGTLAGIADIPKGEIRYTTDNLGTIKTQEYRILSYFILSSSEIDGTADLRYNLTWGSRNHYEDSAFKINTSRYIDESRLSFDIEAIGSFKDRSAEKDEDQLYEFNVTNIGDLNISDSTWNVSLSIPSQCSQSNHTGTYDSGTRKITWPLGPLNISDTNTFYLNLNCTAENSYVLNAEGVSDTRAKTSFSNNTGIGCSFSSGNECTSTESFTFTKPSNPRYEKLDNVNATIFYNWFDYKTTIGQGNVSIFDDSDNENILWQNYSITNPDGTSNTITTNYTLDSGEQGNFVNAARNIQVNSYVDSTSAPNGNVTLTGLDYTWDHGKLFEESQDLFIDIHPFVFDLPTPTLSTPTNGSLQAAIPIGLSWNAIDSPEGVNISYYVFGDTTDASTLLDTTEENLYLWRDPGATQGTFYWKIIATDGTTNTTSEVRQFELDLCQPNTNFAFAESYPMSYNNVTDTISVWGSKNTTGYDVMGSNESDPITFQEIYEFGQAVRGSCATANPSSGSYTILSRLELGNTTDNLNTTFVRTIGESLSFSKQLQLNFNATLISGNLSSGGSPFSGSTLSFGGLDAQDPEEGQLYLEEGSELRLYDTGISHTIAANNSNPFRLYWNGDVKAKSSTLQNWYTIRFLGINNTISNLVLTNMGEGFFPATTQIGGLTNIQPSGIDTGGLVLYTENTSNIEPNVTITGLQVSESEDDILIQNYTGIANLINPTLNFSNLNWTTGSFSGEINRRYDYTPTITDSAGSAIENVSLVLRDIRGDTIFNLNTDTSGTIPSQTVTRSIYNYNFKSGDERGPHTFKVKKFGKNFQTLAKQFSAATVETLQMADNPFVTLSETQVQNLTGITFNLPTNVNYGDEINSSWETTGTVENAPITQSEFFAVFGYNGNQENRKLTLVTDTPNADGEYSVDYQTGTLTFFNNQSGYNVTPVYSHGGNITIATGTDAENCISMSDLYSYMQYNLSETLTTVDGTAYTSFIDLAIGNSTTGGCIVDSSASLSFEDGYTYSFSDVGGYIDLFGVTAGSGSGGGLPLNIFDDVGSTFNPGDRVDIFSTVLDSSGELVSATVSVTTYYPNDTILDSGLSTETSTGRFRRNYTLPSSAPEGTYSINIDATYNDDEVHDTLIYQVENATASGSGSAYPTITLETPDSIATATDTSIGAFITSATGTAVNCDAGINLTIRDAYNGSTVVSSDSMSNFGTGIYNYTWSTPSSSSMYYVNASCSISGTSYEGFTVTSTQPVGAEATVDYNQIAQYVWEYSNRNLTYYNQSVSENLQGCLKDGQCSDWWLNTTLSNINNTLNVINISTTNIESDTQTIKGYFNCTESNDVCTRLDNIDSNVTDIQSRVETLNTTQIPNLQTSVDDVYTDTQWLYTNVATQTNITEVINGIDNLQTNITYIKNNMFYQGNATGSFIVDYLSTAYLDQSVDSRAEIWIQTQDLLGNQKTVSAASCEIWKEGSFVDNGTGTINSGGVYAYWDVPSTSSGSHYWNCTLTGSTVNLVSPFYISDPGLVITSLIAESPKYPDENAVVEATFSNSNGDIVEPDNINMTILKPNYLTVWKTSDKSGFTKNSNNVWYWADTIESNPTTGTYYVNMNASYQGSVASSTAQFRIATGGPYKVFLDCPASVNITEEELTCNVVIQDEGEAPTESTCDVWVDTDGDTAIDGAEPQAQFSKETQPQQNITQEVNISIPTTHPDGFYVSRVSCSYANSVQPDSTASDGLTINGGTNPVCGNGIIETGEECDDGNTVSGDGCSNICETEAVSEEPSSGGGGGGGAPTTPEDVEESYEFSIGSKVIDTSKQILPAEEKITIEIDIASIGSVKNVENVTLRYSIEDSEGNVLASSFENINIDNRLRIVRELSVPRNINLGEYWIVTKIEYNGASTISKDSFEIVDEIKVAPPSVDEIGFKTWILIILITLVVLAILAKLFLGGKRRKKKWWSKFKIGSKKHHERENLKKMIKHIREEA